MHCNVGKTDQKIRLAVGALVFLVGFYFHSWFAVLGLILIATGIVRFCPAYVPFKIETK